LGGSFLECAYWDAPLSAVDANKWNNPHFPGTNHGDGFYVDTCTQATAHANCSLQKCRAGTPVACQAEGTGAMAAFGAHTEIVVDNSGESPAGGDDAPDWPDWVETETAGDGTSAITAYRADTKHGDIAFRLATTGTTSEAQIDQCFTCSSSTNYYVYGSFKEISGNASTLDFYVEEYSGASCTTLVTTNFIAQDQDVPEGTWEEYGDAFTTGGTTVSCKMVILSDSAGDILVDTLTFRSGTYRKPWVENPTGAGTTTYNIRDYALANPLGGWSDVEDEYGWESGFCVSFWWYTDWNAQAANPPIMNAVGTAGNVNRWYFTFISNESMRFYLYDGAGGEMRSLSAVLTNTEFTINDWKYIEACSDNAGTIVAHHYNRANATWYDWGAGSGAGTGIQDDAGPRIYISDSGYCEGYFSEIRISPYETPYPNKGFNGGVPPVNGVGANRRPY
jgi:hypothetical protein